MRLKQYYPNSANLPDMKHSRVVTAQHHYKEKKNLEKASSACDQYKKELKEDLIKCEKHKKERDKKKEEIVVKDEEVKHKKEYRDSDSKRKKHSSECEDTKERKKIKLSRDPNPEHKKKCKENSERTKDTVVVKTDIEDEKLQRAEDSDKQKEAKKDGQDIESKTKLEKESKDKNREKDKDKKRDERKSKGTIDESKEKARQHCSDSGERHKKDHKYERDKHEKPRGHVYDKKLNIVQSVKKEPNAESCLVSSSTKPQDSMLHTHPSDIESISSPVKKEIETSDVGHKSIKKESVLDTPKVTQVSSIKKDGERLQKSGFKKESGMKGETSRTKVQVNLLDQIMASMNSAVTRNKEESEDGI